MSLKAAFWLDPIRDIYEASYIVAGIEAQLITNTGIYDLYLPATAHQFHRRRKIIDNLDAWPPTRSTPVATKSLPL